MNIYDVAKASGVSIATVSRVLNESTHVRPHTREKVLKAIRENNYTPNAFARGLGLNTMRTVGVLYCDPSDMYLANAVHYIERTLRDNEYDSLLCSTGYDFVNRKKAIKLLLSRHVDAIILAGSQYVEEDYKLNDYIRKSARTVPFAILNGTVDGGNIYCAICNDQKATYDLTTHLLDTGSEKVLYLYHSFTDCTRRKIAGLRNAFDARGSTIDENRILPCPYSDIYEIAEFIKEKSQTLSFDTVIGSDDVIAVGAIKYAQMNNISVPDQLRVAGYNNSVLSKCCAPELTTVDNRMEELCSSVVRMLMHHFAEEVIPPVFSLPGEIIKRAST